MMMPSRRRTRTQRNRICQPAITIFRLVVSAFCASAVLTVLPPVAFPSAAAIPRAPASSPQTPDTKQPSGTVSAPDCPDSNRLQKEVARLNSEVLRLRKRVSDLEKDQQVTAIRDQLLKEEKRSEDLQLHLTEIAEKEADLQPKLDSINQQLRPENIERELAAVGSTKPEEVREEVRRRRAAEQQRLQAQLGLMRQDKTRTQSSLSNADLMIQRLKQKLAEAMRP
jgi:hypothetical protein